MKVVFDLWPSLPYITLYHLHLIYQYCDFSGFFVNKFNIYPNGVFRKDVFDFFSPFNNNNVFG
ncbi:MAG: hypothetical protein ACE5WD_14760, partial [Candidatus Aminicenantia bacterium]